MLNNPGVVQEVDIVFDSVQILHTYSCDFDHHREAYKSMDLLRNLLDTNGSDK
jgi:hypothetical protein